MNNTLAHDYGKKCSPFKMFVFNVIPSLIIINVGGFCVLEWSYVAKSSAFKKAHISELQWRLILREQIIMYKAVRDTMN